MIDLIGAIGGAAVYSLIIGVLVGYSALPEARKIALIGVAAVWAAGIVTIAAFGGFAPGTAGAIPLPVFAFAAFLIILFGAWFWSRQFRDALMAVPLPVLVALNIPRVGGILFLLLAAEGRLSDPFATSAGWGDIITGLVAIPMVLFARRSQVSTAPLTVWNAFGALDLIMAISLGLLSAPGTPFRIFTEGPGTLAMTQLPWIMVAALLVPLFLLIHWAVAAKLRSTRSSVLPLGRYELHQPTRGRA
jgi:hypothetical protein